MAQKLHFCILLISLSILLSMISPSFSSPTNNAIDLWCSRTPYPDVCKHFFVGGKFDPKKLSEFKKTALRIAMERALSAETQTKQHGPKCRNEKEKTAWSDCLELYQTTILQLNRTFSDDYCSDFDVQTWLSSALTNLDTCRAGFADLDIKDYDVVFPFLAGRNNVTKLISNSLAMNNCSETGYNNNNSGGSTFPRWVGGGKRRLLQAGGVPKADLVVAQDGSGSYKTVQAAVDAAAGTRKGSGRFVIHIKKGIYKENVVIGNKVKNLMLVGDGMKYTIITGSKSVGAGSTTFNSATVAVTGEGFIARDITFRNTAGPENHQAVALRSGSDLSVFYRCGFEGYQDTLYAHSQRQFYKECYIYGTVDFIFGNAAVVLQNCMIYARKPMTGQQCVVTAQGRTDPNQNTGISIHNSRVMASADLAPVVSSVRTYLGRPWKEYSRTVYMKSFMDGLVNPAGWLEWSGNFALDTLYYGEFKNFGAGSSTAKRVKWKGYRVITSAAEAAKFSVGNFIAGSSWLPGTGIPFTAGL